MDLGRMVRGRAFWGAVLLAAAGLLLGTPWSQVAKGESLPAGTFLSLAAESFRSRIVVFLLPAVSALPYGDAWLQERQWKYLRFLLIRRGKREYCRDKLLVSSLAGPLVWIAGTAVTVLVFFLLFYGREQASGEVWEAAAELLAVVGRAALIASALSNGAAICGILGDSVYLAYGLPFLSYYVLVILRQRYLEFLYCLDPSCWLKGEGWWGTHSLGLWLFLILLALLLVRVHGVVLDRHLQEC